MFAPDALENTVTYGIISEVVPVVRTVFAFSLGGSSCSCF
jgi:hypothetical protein